jgi:aldehyde:ferredoxin oxidoreductase
MMIIVTATLRTEHQFNKNAGITASDHRFTESFYLQSQVETGEKMDITDEEVARARQW